jgi:fluoride exporter
MQQSSDPRARGPVRRRRHVRADADAAASARRRSPMRRPDGRELVAIFAGGAAGALLRAAVADAGFAGPAAWPWPTFAVNVAGAFLLGYFSTRLQERLPLSAYRRPLLGTGLCGALTTFSTVQVELLRLLDAREYATAGSYVVASVVAGYLAVQLATAMTRRVRSV